MMPSLIQGGIFVFSTRYDAFGNLQGTPSLETNYLYTGQQFDVISELYSLRARYYDASIGRFLSRDTWAYDYQNPVELNRYVYAANNPATWSDPSGYSAFSEITSIFRSISTAAKIYPAIGGIVGAGIGAIVGGLYAATTYAATSVGLCGSRQISDHTTYILWGIIGGTVAGGIAGASGAVLAPVWAKVVTGGILSAVGLYGLYQSGSELFSDATSGAGFNACAAVDAVMSTMALFYGARMLKSGVQEMISQAADSLVGKILGVNARTGRPVDIGSMGVQTERAGRMGILDEWIRTRGTLQTGGAGRNKFPTTGTPDTLLFSTHDGTTSGSIQRYAVYNQYGQMALRIDLVGPAHGGVPTPHTLLRIINIDPSGQEHITNAKLPYISFPWEIP